MVSSSSAETISSVELPRFPFSKKKKKTATDAGAEAGVEAVAETGGKPAAPAPPTKLDLALGGPGIVQLDKKIFFNFILRARALPARR